MSEPRTVVRSELPASRAVVAVALIAIAAGLLRTYLSWPAVFGEYYVAFLESDAWYHMRLVDALVRDFPWRIWHDPYQYHPGGETVTVGPVLDWLIAGVALLIGRGLPTPGQVDLVGASLPPIAGALTIVMVYGFAQQAFSARVGIWAAFVAAVVPGQFLQRTLLGFTDHHCLEPLFSTAAMVCLAAAVNAGTRETRRRLALASGLALGAYLLTWGGGVVFVLLVGVWALGCVIVAAVRRSDAGAVVAAVVTQFTVAALMVAPWATTRPQFAYQLAALMLGGIAVWTLERLVVRHTARPSTRDRALLIGIVAALLSVVAVFVFASAGGSALATDVLRVLQTRTDNSVAEAAPLMRSELWRPFPLWKEFTTALVLAAAGALLMTRGGATRPWLRSLFVCWTLVMLAASFGQIRFTQYLAVNIAILAGIACDRLVSAAWQRRPRESAVVALVLAGFVALPNLDFYRQIHRGQPTPNAQWMDALHFLAERTPDPFGDPDTYYRRDARAPSSYGVLAWWDYGYWITRIGRRVPVANPRQSGMREAAAFYLATTESEGQAILDQLGVRYVAVDWQLQAPSAPDAPVRSLFEGIATAGGRSIEDYCGLFTRDPAAPPVVYCYPWSYQTTAMRLYLYGGRAVAPTRPVTVVRSQPQPFGAYRLNVITGEWTFDTYAQAQRFLDTTFLSDVRIVCTHHQETCVSLDPLPAYRRVYSALARDGSTADAPPVVQLFEYRNGDTGGR